MKVVVVGAGIGGLALAQALRRNEIDVVVVDRDPAVEATGGYRLSLDERACVVLRRYLRPAHYQALLASSAGWRTYRRFHVTDHRMRLLFAEQRDRATENLLIGRIPLRRLLVHGLEDAVRFGAEFTGHIVHPDGTVTAHLADGTTERGDLLVGADGVGSRVATALAGHPTSAPAGVSGIAGRTPLTDRIRAVLPSLLAEGPALAFGPGGVGMFLTVHDPTAGTVIDPATCTDVPAFVEPGSVIWGLLAPDHAYPDGTRHLDGLTGVAERLLAGWAGSVRELVRATDPETAAFFRFHTADPAGDLTPWPAGPVTALGDAVHAMPPTGGQAAVTAIRDADVLAEELIRVKAGESTVPMAVHRFQSRMASYAGAAVRESLQPLGWTNRLAGPTGTLLAKMALPTLAIATRFGRALAGTRHG